MDHQLIDNNDEHGAADAQDRSPDGDDDEKIEIHLPGRHKRKTHRKDGAASATAETLFPAPPAASGSRRAHQTAAAASVKSAPPPRPSHAPKLNPAPGKDSSSTAAPDIASKWELFDEGEGDDEESGSAVSSDVDDEDDNIERKGCRRLEYVFKRSRLFIPNTFLHYVTPCDT